MRDHSYRFSVHTFTTPWTAYKDSSAQVSSDVQLRTSPIRKDPPDLLPGRELFSSRCRRTISTTTVNAYLSDITHILMECLIQPHTRRISSVIVY